MGIDICSLMLTIFLEGFEILYKGGCFAKIDFTSRELHCMSLVSKIEDT